MKISSVALAIVVALAGVTAASAAPSTAVEHRWERLLKLGDKNTDGAITRAEARQSAARRAGRMDADRNGIITRAEFTAVNKAHASKTGGNVERLVAARAKAFDRLDRAGAGQIYRADMVQEMVRRVMAADADRNGILTKAEFQARAVAAARRRG